MGYELVGALVFPLDQNPHYLLLQCFGCWQPCQVLSRDAVSFNYYYFFIRTPEMGHKSCPNPEPLCIDSLRYKYICCKRCQTEKERSYKTSVYRLCDSLQVKLDNHFQSNDISIRNAPYCTFLLFCVFIMLLGENNIFLLKTAGNCQTLHIVLHRQDCMNYNTTLKVKLDSFCLYCLIPRVLPGLKKRSLA